MITNYTYDLWDNLSQVNMPRSAGTQTRTFVYTGSQLQNATNPETGSVNYSYNPDGTLARKIDAKGQTISYYYDNFQRPVIIYRNLDPCQQLLISYDTNGYDGSFSQNASGRKTVERWGGPHSCVRFGFNSSSSFKPAGSMRPIIG